MIARSHHGAHRGMFEAQGIGLRLKRTEGVRVDIAGHRQVMNTGGEVLAEGEHVNAVRAHLMQGLDNFFIALTQAHHEAAFGGDVGVLGLEFFEQIQTEVVVASGAHLGVKPWHRLQVVVHDIGGGAVEDAQGAVVTTPKIGHQDFNLGLRRENPDSFDALHKVLAAPVSQVVSVNACDHHVFQFQGRHGLGQMLRLQWVEGVRAGVTHIAKWAAPCALVAHDHEGGGARSKAFANVGARGLFAHGHEFVAAQNVFDLVKPRSRRGRFHADPVGFLKNLECALHLDGNLGELRLGFLFDAGVVGCGHGDVWLRFGKLAPFTVSGGARRPNEGRAFGPNPGPPGLNLTRGPTGANP